MLLKQPRDCIYSQRGVEKRGIHTYVRTKERAGQVIPGRLLDRQARGRLGKREDEDFAMIVLRKANGATIVRLSALLLALLLPLASLASCSQPAPLFESLKLGIPAAALQSPVVGPLPDATELRVGITFKIDPQALKVAGQQPLRPGQSSGLERFARSLGISDATYQKIANFFNAQGLVLHLSK